MKLITGLMFVLLLVAFGMAGYLLSRPSTTVLPFFALIAILILILLRPLRQHFLPEVAVTPSALLVKALVGGGVLLFILVISVILLMVVAGGRSLY
mgnify:CR=1 FL=1